MSSTFEDIDLREKLAHIDQMLADIDRTFARERKRWENPFAPWQIGATMLGGAAAFFAAGAAFMKLVIG